MINVTKMKKIVKANICLWGVEEINGKQYMLVCDGYRVYKDNIYAFDPKVKAALFERFGLIPKVGETYSKGKDGCDPTKTREISSLLPKQECYEDTYFTNMLYRTETMTNKKGEAYVFSTTKGLLFINRDYLDVLKDLDEAEVSTSDGSINGMSKFTFPNRDTEYYVLPLRMGKENEAKFYNMIDGIYEAKMKGGRK